jgi:hypothetical protein
MIPDHSFPSLIYLGGTGQNRTQSCAEVDGSIARRSLFVRLLHRKRTTYPSDDGLLV